MFLVCIGLGFSSMHRAIGVFWRRIDRIELEISLSDVDHVVPHTGWNNETPIILDLMALIHCVTGLAISTSSEYWDAAQKVP